MLKIGFAFIAGLSFGVATSCSQPPEAAVPKSESLAASASSKNSDSIQKDESDSEGGAEGGTGLQAEPKATPTTQSTPNPSAIAGDCSNTSSVRTDSVTVTVRKNIPSSGGMQCPFGMGDNAAKTGGKFAARIELNQTVTLPADRKVCGINPSAASQMIKYDDNMFLNLNGFVLVASRGIPGEFELDASGFRKYDWSKLVNTDRGSTMKCAEGVVCQIPPTESGGDFAFSLGENARKKLFASLGDRPLQFTVVLTGDNDSPTDCMLQNDLTLTLNYSYVAK